jgi:hypothetical protein
MYMDYNIHKLLIVKLNQKSILFSRILHLQLLSVFSLNVKVLAQKRNLIQGLTVLRIKTS